MAREQIVVGPDEAGKTCPYCRFPLKLGIDGRRCGDCGTVHHLECWDEGAGCAILGCPSAGSAPDELRREPPAAPVAPAATTPARTGARWLLYAALAIAAGVVGSVAVAVGLAHHGRRADTTGRVVTVTAATPTPAAPLTMATSTATSSPPAGGYLGDFTSADRLQRCAIAEDSVTCTSGPSGEGVRLERGAGVTALGAIGSRDVGGRAMAEGKSIHNPSGSIRCESSSRGITCTDLAGSGAAFTIGDTRIRTSGPGSVAAPTAPAQDGYFASIDRKELCHMTGSWVECVATPSAKTVRLDAGGAASYLGKSNAIDRGGPSLAFGSSRTNAGSIRCSSSTRGITCVDRVAGASFVIGDYRVIVVNSGTPERY
jgi:hypothetical protein